MTRRTTRQNPLRLSPGFPDRRQTGRVSRGHGATEKARDAAEIASYTVRSYTPLASPAGGFVRSRMVGQGNFGLVYRVDHSARGVFAVKIPSATDMHENVRPRDVQTRWFRHEAAVYEALRALKSPLATDVTYAEFDGGTPALVREYGDPVASMTAAEVERVESELLRLEWKHRWRVQDNLSLYRRADGSLFVGDVGLWSLRPAADRMTLRGMRERSSVPDLMRQLGEAVKIEGAPATFAALLRARGRLMVAAILGAKAKPDARDIEAAQELLRIIAHRQREGMPLYLSAAERGEMERAAKIVLRNAGR